MATIGQVQTINGNFTVNGKPLTEGMTISSDDIIKGNGAISVALTDGRTINLKGDVEQLFDETMVANIEDMEDGAIAQESLDAVIDYTVPNIEEELAAAQEENPETATITYEEGVSDTEINNLFNDIFEDYNADQVIDTNSYVGDRIASVDLQVTEQIIQDI